MSKLAPLKTILKIIGRKFITSNSSKMKPLLNASKGWQTVPAGSLSARPM